MVGDPCGDCRFDRSCVLKSALGTAQALVIAQIGPADCLGQRRPFGLIGATAAWRSRRCQDQAGT
jgi:hypothetical protein